MKGKNRLASVDCARALCMLYIVGIHHMLSYVRPGTVVEVLANHATPALCAFTAISACFMGRKSVDSARDAAAFYRSRLARVYPLYLLGCVTLYVASLFASRYFQGPGQLVLALAGLSMVFGPPPKTMWYMSMLLLFWLLTPPFLYKKKGGQGGVLARCAGLAALMAALWALSRLGVRVDARLYPYGAIYFGTLIAADYLPVDDKFRPLPALAAAAVLALSSLAAARRIAPANLCQLLGGCAGAVLIFAAGQLCALWKPLARVLSRASYASMAAYLFHRQWLGLWFYLLGPFSLPLAALLLLALLAGAYLLQWLYDRRVAPRLAG